MGAAQLLLLETRDCHHNLQLVPRRRWGVCLPTHRTGHVGVSSLKVTASLRLPTATREWQSWLRLAPGQQLSVMKVQPVFAAAAAVRALLICFGEWQDAHLTVRYTDVDYAVFTDAARFVSQGLSPVNPCTARVNTRDCNTSGTLPAPSRGSAGLAGVFTRPAGLPHPWGAISCRKAAPLT